MRILLAISVLVLPLLAPASALACSPPFEPTIQALGPAQVVVVGRIGERVANGRLFHVERWFNGGVPGTPILIAFKEGEPVGDCSYPVQTGQHLLITPVADAFGQLSADLGTLQADPATPDGRRFLAEAEQLFGPGVVPPAVPIATPAPAQALGTTDGSGMAIVVIGLVAVVALLFGLVIIAGRRRPSGD